MHKTLDKLYAGIGEAGTGRSGVGELCALAALSANLYTLVCVAPWLDEEYGSAGELRRRIRKVAAALVCRLERETDDLERVRGVNALFVLSNMAAEYEQKMLDLAEPVLGRYEAGRLTAEAALFEAEVCRMMCNCYCLVQDEALAADARTIISGWTAVSPSGTEGLPVGVALARCEAAAAYADYTGDERFRAVRSTGDCGTEEPETICRMLELHLRCGAVSDAEALCDRIEQDAATGTDRTSQVYRLAAKAACELLRIKDAGFSE